MRILILGPHLNYNLEYFSKINLERLGCEVRFCGYAASLGRLASATRLAITRSNTLDGIAQRTLLLQYKNEIRKVAAEFRPEVVLVIKGEAVDSSFMEEIRRNVGSRIALWYTDDPRYYGTIIRRTIFCYDYVFTVSPKAVNTYRGMGIKNIQCIPVACDPNFHKEVALDDRVRRRYESDVVFVGTYSPRRARLVNALRKSGIGVKVYGPYWNLTLMRGGVGGPITGPEMVSAFNAAKIVLNVHVDSDVAFKVNTRTYEGAGCRSFVLTDKTYGMAESFRIGQEIECYDDEKELVELAKHFLASHAEREEMAIKGQERAYHEHTYALRLERMLAALK